MKVLDVHKSSLEASSTLTGYSMARFVRPEELIAVLNKARVSFVLVGLHGLSGWLKEPRATQDVDVIVAIKHLRKAVSAILAAFDFLEAEEHDVVMRFLDRDTRQVLIDVMKPNQQLFRAAFRNVHTVRSGKQSYRIPSLEMAIAMKFAPMIRLHRKDADKYQDAHDFILMIQANANIDLNKVKELGELVYPGGGAELLEMVRRVRAGEKLNL